MPQVSDEWLDTVVAPKLSKLKVCGAKRLPKRINRYSKFFFLVSPLSNVKFKNQHLRTLLASLLRRIDFSAEEYSHGRRRMTEYVSRLPRDNTQTRYYRLALCHFETCLLHLDIALRLLKKMENVLKAEIVTGDTAKQVRGLSNRVRHSDEDAMESSGARFLASVWLLDDGIESSKHFLSFDDLRSALIDADKFCAHFLENMQTKVTLHPAPHART